MEANVLDIFSVSTQLPFVSFALSLDEIGSGCSA